MGEVTSSSFEAHVYTVSHRQPNVMYYIADHQQPLPLLARKKGKGKKKRDKRNEKKKKERGKGHIRPSKRREQPSSFFYPVDSGAAYQFDALSQAKGKNEELLLSYRTTNEGMELQREANILVMAVMALPIIVDRIRDREMQQPLRSNQRPAQGDNPCWRLLDHLPFFPPQKFPCPPDAYG